MRRLWTDSLFRRMLLVQCGLVATAGVIFSVMLNIDRNVLLVRPYAALASPALRQLSQLAVGSAPLPAMDLPGGIRREAAAPQGFRVPGVLRPMQAAREVLHARGIDLEEAWLTRCFNGCEIWIAYRVDGGDKVWATLNGYPFLPSWSLAAAVSLLLVLAVIAIVSHYFVRRVTQPLARLHDRMLSHAGSGVALPPPADDPRGPPPPELQAMDRAYGQLADKLARNERERALLLAGVSHDLRSPLARIRLAAEMLPETPDNADGVAAITRNVDQTDRLIGSFLEFVRAGTQKLDETVDAAAVVLQAVAGFNLPPADLIAQAPERLLLRQASGLLLERLVVNLVENALKHGQLPVQVHLSCEGQAMQLAVTDSGPGLPDGGAERLMEAFARGDTSRGVPGFGLGLAIVHQIVTRLQGQLHFERSPRYGHSVQVTVPLDR